MDNLEIIPLQDGSIRFLERPIGFDENGELKGWLMELCDFMMKQV